MITYICMGVLLIVLCGELLIKAQIMPDSKHFFDLDNTKAMRGFWCIIVVLVHIPSAYQNKVVDIVGSFGYIGVTFFFMTSGYGLTLSTTKKDIIPCFWRKRLPKLLLTSWIINITFEIINLILFNEAVSFWSIINIKGWVLWLIGCYFIFWITQIVLKNTQRLKYIVCALLISASSLAIYFMKKEGIVTDTVWVTECYGFIWGLLLALLYTVFVDLVSEKYIKFAVLAAALSLILGVSYLKFKTVFFAGDYLLKIVLGVSITLLILVCNTRIKLGNRVSLFLGSISFEIYLIHGRAFGIIEKLLPDVGSGEFVWISLLGTIALAFLVHFISDWTVKKTNKILLK